MNNKAQNIGGKCSSQNISTNYKILKNNKKNMQGL